MQTDKIKRVINSTFITNHDLLQVLRKKSIKGSNEASSKELNKRVNLLCKKSPDSVRRDNSAILERNSSILEKKSVSELDPYTNKDRKNVKQNPLQSVTELLQQLQQNIPQAMHKYRTKTKKCLTILREAQQDLSKHDVRCKLQENQKESMLLRKIQEQCREKIELKLERDSLKERIKELQELLRGQKRDKKAIKQLHNLQQIILSQSEIINKQCEQHAKKCDQYSHINRMHQQLCSEYDRLREERDKLAADKTKAGEDRNRQSNDLHYMLLTQAKQIEQQNIKIQQQSLLTGQVDKNGYYNMRQNSILNLRDVSVRGKENGLKLRDSERDNRLYNKMKHNYSSINLYDK